MKPLSASLLFLFAGLAVGLLVGSALPRHAKPPEVFFRWKGETLTAEELGCLLGNKDAAYETMRDAMRLSQDRIEAQQRTISRLQLELKKAGGCL